MDSRIFVGKTLWKFHLKVREENGITLRWIVWSKVVRMEGEVNWTGLGSWPVARFGISSVDPLGFSTTQLGKWWNTWWEQYTNVSF
jgi:hypothetical protein